MSIASVVNDTVTSESVINALKPLPPTISGYSVGGLDDTALDPAGGQTVQINGTGFLAGATITFDGNAVAVVTYVNPNQLTFTSPAKSAGTYTIYVVNSDGGTAIFIPGIIYSVLPTWTTSAGTLGSYYETTSISNTVVASGDAPITYSLFSGSLPTGSTLYANGVITGTAPVDSSSTTYSFTIQASDAQLQDSTRSFSLTINVDAVTWVSPANATTYTSAVDSAIANVALSATDAAGYGVSYSANALPTGLTLTGSNIAGTPTVVADSSTLLTATAATTNRTATRTINWSIIVANDVYFEYNTLLIPGASTTFVDDASTNNFALTISGDTKPNNFNPYTPGYYSNYFDGTGDDLTTATNAAFAFGTGDYTFECWINTNSTAQQVLFGSGGTGTNNFYFSFVPASSFIGVGTQLAYVLQATSISLLTGVWYHVAASRSSGTLKLFLNGSQVASGADSTTWIQGGSPAIGSNAASGQYTNGYIFNLRVVKGVAVYTGTFTPPTAPLTATQSSGTNISAITGTQTSLLTCQSNRFIDNSTNNFALTVYGNTTINPTNPFVPNTAYATYGSTYFDGTGDYLTAPTGSAFQFAGNFTVEAWVNSFSATGQANWSSIFDTRATNVSSATGIVFNLNPSGYLNFYINGTNYTSTVLLGANNWTHVALVRNSSTITLYQNGVSIASVSYATSLTSGYCWIGSLAGPAASGYWQGYISNLRVVNGTAVYTSAFTPPSTPLTAIANTSLLTLQTNQPVNNNVFLDNSTNNFFVTRNGNTTQGTFSPYGGNWSNYFDGTGDYLTVGTSANLSVSTSDFTIEAWVYLNSGSTYQYVLGATGNGGMQVGLNVPISGTPTIALATANVAWILNFGASITIPTATWTHIAITRSGSTNRAFINGVQLGSNITDSTNWTFPNNTLQVGATLGAEVFSGYISNLRVVKGTAVYTSTFTPSTTPLTSITNTSLLTCQSNRIVDTSINNFTITKNGDVSVQRFSPFNPSSVTPTSYSGYFDGSGDYLSLPSNAVFSPGTSEFTIEFWYYPLASLSNAGIFDTRTSAVSVNGILVRQGDPSGLTIGAYLNNTTFITSGTLLNLNAWNHVAIVRNSSNSVVTYVNGIGGSGTTISTNLTDGTSNTPFIGRFVDTAASPYAANGYISNFRMVKGVAVYTGNFTVPTSPLQSTQSSGTNIAAITGTSTSLLTLQSTTFIDNSTNNFTISAFGNSQPTQQNPFGFTSATTNGYTVSTIGGSGYFDGTGDYITYPSSNVGMNFGSGDFTVEAWVYPIVTPGDGSGPFAGASGTTNPLILGYHANAGLWEFGRNFVVWDYSFSQAPILNTWQHLAVSRSGTTLRLFFNGVLKTTATTSQGYSMSGGGTQGWNGGSGYITGYISDARATNTALYTASFIPPTSPLIAIPSTQLLLNYTSAGIIDNTMINNLETVGDAKISTAVSKFGGSSMSFDGTGDNLNLRNNTVFAFNTGDFTIEAWVYPTAAHTGAGMVIFDQRGTYNTSNGINMWLRGSTNILTFSTNGNQEYAGSLTAPVNTWTHVAVVKTSGVIKSYVNGVLSTTFSYATSLSDTSACIGRSTDTNVSYYFEGYIDDLRVTNGVARYTANFAPPTAAFPIY